MPLKFLSTHRMALVAAAVSVLGGGMLATGAQALPLGTAAQLEKTVSGAANFSSASAVDVQSRRQRRRRARRNNPAETDPRFVNDRTNPNVTFYGNGRFRDCPGVDAGNSFKTLPCWAQFAFDDRGDRRRR